MVLGNITSFNQDVFDQQTTRMIVVLRLSFRSLENIELKKWIRMALLATYPSKLLNAHQIRSSLDIQAEIAR
jgi:hypothetical protein